MLFHRFVLHRCQLAEKVKVIVSKTCFRKQGIILLKGLHLTFCVEAEIDTRRIARVRVIRKDFGHLCHIALHWCQLS